ncbi:MAG: SDR family oxidoreductase [Parabacteroides sp.]|nr:SDR family oxidoreductase [Parabacteroides sp.]
MKKYFKRVLTWLLKGVPVIKITASISQLSSSEKLAGKKVVVTGGGRGLGFYMAKKFIEEGASVLITGRDEKVLKEASSLLNNCPFISFDVQRIENIPLFIKEADKLLGGNIDCLVNNAGISLHESSFTSVTIEGFDKQFTTNLKAPYFLSQAFVSYWEKNQMTNTNILFITSERGLYCDVIPYGLTKAAINSLTAGLSRKYIKKGFRINAIAPGVTASDMTGFNKNGDLYRENSCGQRVFLPEEVAESAVFLLSDAAKCISGEILPCNQGNHYRCDW